MFFVKAGGFHASLCSIFGSPFRAAFLVNIAAVAYQACCFKIVVRLVLQISNWQFEYYFDCDFVFLVTLPLQHGKRIFKMDLTLYGKLSNFQGRVKIAVAAMTCMVFFYSSA